MLNTKIMLLIQRMLRVISFLENVTTLSLMIVFISSLSDDFEIISNTYDG